jgi:ParB/RepB/Spo0J family partition protein
VSTQVLEVPVGELMADPHQPRQVWVQSELDRMATSIAARGIKQPLRVRWDKERKCWRIVTGESRWRAAKQAGLKTVPCWPMEGEPDEMDMLADQIVENHCRNDLRPTDLGRAMAKLKKLKKNVTPKAGRVAGKLDGVSFSFAFSAGELTPEALLGAIEKIRSKLKELQRGDHKDVSALAELLRAS